MQKSETFTALNGLRFLAALAVVIYHYGTKVEGYPRIPGIIKDFINLGPTAVSFFFILSGFVLAYRQLHSGSRVQPSAAFYWARFARLYPAYLLAFLLFLPIAVQKYILSPSPTIAGQHTFILSAVLSFLMLQSWTALAQAWNGPSWSLSVEAFMYLLFPLIGFRLTRLNNRNTVFVLLVSWLIPLSLALAHLDHWISDVTWRLYIANNPLLWLPFFAMGICAIRTVPAWNKVKNNRANILSTSSFVALILVALLWPHGWSDIFVTGGIAPLLVAVTIFFTRKSGWTTRIIGGTFLSKLGEASYVIYILQAPLWHYWQGLTNYLRRVPIQTNVVAAWQFFAFLPFLILASLAVQRFIETPLRAWIGSWKKTEPASLNQLEELPVEHIEIKFSALTQGKEVNAMQVSTGPNQPFRILYFDHTAALGGGEIALLNLIRYTDRKHITPIVVLCSDGPLADRLRSICEVYILSLPERVRKTQKDSLGWRSLLKLRDIASVVFCSIRLAIFAVKRNVNLIHTNSLKADIIGGMAGRLARRPVVWHVRDRIEADYLPKSTVHAFRFLCRFLPSYVIANSQAVLKTLHLPQRYSQTSIPSGVVLPRTSKVVHDATIIPPVPASDSSSEKLQVIALIGRICPWKGQHIFLQAAAAVRQRFPNTRFKIVGAALFGEEEYEARIRKLCTDLSLDAVVEFTGFCTNVDKLIPGFDLVVHASTTGEPFGQVIVEGMAAGKPVVATSGGGVPEIVVDTVTGFLVPMGDAAAMAEAICKTLADPAMARRMGSQGFMRVQKLFTIESVAEKVKAIYHQILDTPHFARVI